MKEIERKFIIDNKKWKPKQKGIQIKQGYLSVDPSRTVRIRISEAGSFLTVKGKTEGITRTELEYKIPNEDAELMFEMCHDFPIVKTRYKEQIGGFIWEIDVFEQQNEGLFLAEIELENEEQEFELPAWILKEVSGDSRYYNSWISQHPFKTWKY